ncbi:MAG: hypothetical protein N2690_07035 [Rhodocyclaceae bacterium]|nr:hypothetical protein [Rhodocyclaceae bacterium]
MDSTVKLSWLSLLHRRVPRALAWLLPPQRARQPEPIGWFAFFAGAIWVAIAAAAAWLGDPDWMRRDDLKEWISLLFFCLPFNIIAAVVHIRHRHDAEISGWSFALALLLLPASLAITVLSVPSVAAFTPALTWAWLLAAAVVLVALRIPDGHYLEYALAALPATPLVAQWLGLLVPGPQWGGQDLGIFWIVAETILTLALVLVVIAVNHRAQALIGDSDARASLIVLHAFSAFLLLLPLLPKLHALLRMRWRDRREESSLDDNSVEAMLASKTSQEIENDINVYTWYMLPAGVVSVLMLASPVMKLGFFVSTAFAFLFARFSRATHRQRYTVAQWGASVTVSFTVWGAIRYLKVLF